ncbi:uncharacterized protein [Aegilops tauschii subsp. strangulata]|uniref:uncharacterized protein n=1 Tax=Aegilops tauschii subsp. strangulata TaxID=200361 RepID=UPI003CC8D231
MSGGKCKVGWSVVTSPVNRGGLGIPDLERFARALRLRWLWLSWKHPDRPWAGLGTPCDVKDQALFASATSVTVRSGATASFWRCHLLGEWPLCLAYPVLFKHFSRKNRTVMVALQREKWIHDPRHGKLVDILP